MVSVAFVVSLYCPLGLAHPETSCRKVTYMSEPIEYLVSEYRDLNKRGKEIESRKDEIKVLLEPIISGLEGSKWEDSDGHAMIKSRSASVSYSGKEVDNLVQAWLVSDDPIIASCGQMLKNLRQERQPSRYLEIR